MACAMRTLFASLWMVILTTNATSQSFDRADWDVRCWNSAERLWKARGLDTMEVTQKQGVTKVTNTSRIHKHAHLVLPAKLPGDFAFTIELKGGYELGWLNRAGKDEMLYVEIGEATSFQKFELMRQGTRFTITRNGRPRPLVHWRFDYGEDCLITLAIKQGESVEIRSCSLATGRDQTSGGTRR